MTKQEGKLDRRQLTKRLVLGAVAGSFPRGLAQSMEALSIKTSTGFSSWSTVAPGISKATLGVPEQHTPVGMRQYPLASAALDRLPPAGPQPVEEIRGEISQRGAIVHIPLEPGERIYGLGLQMYSVEQRGRKKTLRVNADPRADTGDSHAPVPFLVTTRGWGVFIDTARYITVYCGNEHPKDQLGAAAGVAQQPASIVIEVPLATGVDVYMFAGPTMLQAVQRYNLFSGGGCLPPKWGLGFWYRADRSASAQDVLSLAKELRDSHIPCDVLGLEPGWQSHAYSCTYVWDSGRFPDPSGFVKSMRAMDYEVNLWEHAFTNPASPIFEELRPFSGDYAVWGGLVPDFAAPPARKIFGDYHRKSLIDLGISGFKLDECDNSDYTKGWSFPELSRFPSGVDGEQMHSVFGLRYQDAILAQFEAAGKQSYGLVRSSGALAAPYPFVLYSDLYDHRVFIRALVNSGFSGLLWCPELRDAQDTEDLIRRLQSVVFSPLAMIDCWYIKNPPWKQQDRKKNNAGEFNPGWEALEATCRKIIDWRMELVPYLLSSFAVYHSQGIPPFRALALDWPDDPRVAAIDDQYLFGDRMMVAPFFAGDKSRSIVLPQGEWCDYWTGERVGGGVTLTVPAVLEKVPVYVRSGSVFPIAATGLSTKDPVTREVTARIYGDGSLSWSLGDGGENRWELSWDAAAGKGREVRIDRGRDAYHVVRWLPMR
jgi:alpha-D-xyloside xylohydrolase